MKTPFLLIVLVASALGTRAQEYYLNLKHQQLAVPDRTVAVEQVLDGRRSNLAIGYVRRGLSNERPCTIFFRQEAGTVLTEFVRARLPTRPTDYPLVLCLRRLYLNEERADGVESAGAYLSLDAYWHRADGYHFVQSVAGHTSGRAPDVTFMHAPNVALLLSYCLSQLSSQADWETALAQPARTLAQLPTDVPVAQPSRAAHAPLPPILRELPRRGIYRSFAQFLANRPDTSVAFRVDTLRPQLRSYLAERQWQRVPWVRPLLADSLGRPAVPTASWGFSDGQSLFVRHEEHFFPLLRQGRFFTTVGNAPLDELYARNRRIGHARDGHVLAQPHIPPSISDVPVGYAVDMDSGELSPYPGLHAPIRPDTAYVYVYRPAQAAGPAQVQVWLNGKAAGTLRAGEYLELPWMYYATLFSLCLTDGTQGSACQHIIPDVARPNYLRVSFSAAAPLWQWVPPSQGQAELDALDRLAKRE
jgi:hypothetical protein